MLVVCHGARSARRGTFYSCLCNATIELDCVRCGDVTARRTRLFTLTALAVAAPTGGEVPYKPRTKLTVTSLIRLNASAGEENTCG